MTATWLAGSLVAVFLAGVLQRVTGLGFALVASPVLVVGVGADEAVRLVVVTSLASSSYALAATREHCRPEEVWPLLVFALLAIWPAAFLAKMVAPAVASVVAGVTVLVALGLALRPRGPVSGSRWSQAAAAGSLSGVMNAMAALGGPMAAAYGLGRGWGRALAPNLHLFLLLTSVAVLLARGWPATTGPTQLAALAVAAAGGVWLGGRLVGPDSVRLALTLTVAVSAAGAVAAVGQGVASLAGAG